MYPLHGLLTRRLVVLLRDNVLRSSITRNKFVSSTRSFHGLTSLFFLTRSSTSEFKPLAPQYQHHHHHHFQVIRTLSTPTGSSNKTESNSTGTLNETESTSTEPSKKKADASGFLKLVKLAKPESKLFVLALVCLLITSAVSMSLPLILGKIIDTVREDSDPNSLKVDDGTYVFGLTEPQFYSSLAILFTLGAIANFSRTYILRLMGEKLVARLRLRLFMKILQQDTYFFDLGFNGKSGVKTGDLISRITADTQIILKALSSNISDGARALLSGAVGLSMMCYVLWKLTLSMSLIFPPLILMSFTYGRRIKALAKTIQENLGSLTKVTEEKLSGIRTIQSFAQQHYVVHEYNQEIRKIFKTSLFEGKLMGVYFGINQLLGNVMLVGLLVIGTRFIASGDITLGDLSSFMMYTVYTAGSVFGVGNFYTEMMKGIGASERIFELLELKPKIKISHGEKLELINGEIEFRNINFAYPSRKESPVFHKDTPLNLKIAKGDHICFVGPSGSGKSTISQLLLRFYEPAEGEVMVNGSNINTFNLNHYRQQIGYVDQQPFLFSGSIRDNITFGKKDASEEEIIKASKESNCYDFIQEFPEKFDTIIGSNGAQLSGGQKQRISLARTLLKNPKLIVLDEATSALDLRSEEIVMKNITKLSRENGVTLILIAHRLSTIKNSENIIVLNGSGEIVEQGKFNQLIDDDCSKLNGLLKNHEVE